MHLAPDDVLDFWHAAGPKRWFAKDDAFDAWFDAWFKACLEATDAAAAAADLDPWQAGADGALALRILQEPFARNVLRESTPEALQFLRSGGFAG